MRTMKYLKTSLNGIHHVAWPYFQRVSSSVFITILSTVFEPSECPPHCFPLSPPSFSHHPHSLTTLTLSPPSLSHHPHSLTTLILSPPSLSHHLHSFSLSSMGFLLLSHSYFFQLIIIASITLLPPSHKHHHSLQSPPFQTLPSSTSSPPSKHTPPHLRYAPRHASAQSMSTRDSEPLARHG